MITLSTLPLPATRGSGGDVWNTLTALTQSDIAALLEQYSATANGWGPIATLAAPVGGSGYTNGTYTAVPLLGGKGYGATATITVAGNVVTTVTMVNDGVGYAVGDVLTAVIPGGTGFSDTVATVTATTVGTDAQTKAFAAALFAFVANRFALMNEITQAVANAFNAAGSPVTLAQEDEYKNPSAELVDNGVAATPQNQSGVYVQP